jgi:hypothetical protein
MQGGADADPVARERRDTVKKVSSTPHVVHFRHSFLIASPFFDIFAAVSRLSIFYFSFLEFRILSELSRSVYGYQIYLCLKT